MQKAKMALIVLFLAALLPGCTTGNANAQKSGELLITQSLQTVQAMLTQTAAAQPSATPTGTATTAAVAAATATTAPTPALPLDPAQMKPPASSPTTQPVTYSACDMASFVSDVTIPDGTEMDGGKAFTKTWELRNAGTCTWNSSYLLVFYSGTIMDGPTTQQLTTGTVAPGETLDISVDLVAPSTTGTYIGYWVLRNASSVNFGIGSAGQPFYVKIVVGADATSTPTLTPTATEVDSATSTPTSTSAPTATETPIPTNITAPTETPVPTETPAATAVLKSSFRGLAA